MYTYYAIDVIVWCVILCCDMLCYVMFHHDFNHFQYEDWLDLSLLLLLLSSYTVLSCACALEHLFDMLIYVLWLYPQQSILISYSCLSLYRIQGPVNTPTFPSIPLPSTAPTPFRFHSKSAPTPAQSTNGDGTYTVIEYRISGVAYAALIIAIAALLLPCIAMYLFLRSKPEVKEMLMTNLSRAGEGGGYSSVNEG